MNINLDKLVSISEANQNFSRVARLADAKGAVIILKNNVPAYVLINYEALRENTEAMDMDVQEAAGRLLKKHLAAFEALAK